MLAAYGWRGTSVLFGIPAIVIAVLILLLVRERGTDRAAAVAHGSVRSAFRQIVADRDLRWLYLTSVLGGGGRGLGVANLFALIYLTKVIGLDDQTSGLMYGALIVFSVPMPLVAGWLSDRIGRKPLIVGVYVGGAIGFAAFLLAGSSLRRPVDRYRGHGPVQLRREPAAPGAPGRHRAGLDPRRVVRPVLHAGVRCRLAVGGPLRADHRQQRCRRRGADRVRPDGRDLPPRRARRRSRSGPSRRA